MIKFKQHKKSEIYVLSEKLDKIINHLDDNSSRIEQLEAENLRYAQEVSRLTVELSVKETRWKSTRWSNDYYYLHNINV